MSAPGGSSVLLSLNPFDYETPGQDDPPNIRNQIQDSNQDQGAITQVSTIAVNLTSSSSSRYTKIEIEPDYTITSISEEDENAVIRFFLSQRVYGYPKSNGTMCSNYCCFIRQNHPFLSICLLDRRNPYTAKQRVIVFYCVSCLAIVLSYIILHTNAITALAICKAGCKIELDKCIGGPNDGYSYIEYSKRCSVYSPQSVSVAIGVALLPYGSLLRFCSVCSCLQGRTLFQSNILGERMKGFIEWLGGSIMTFFVLAATTMVLYVVGECWSGRVDDWGIFESFALSKVFSSLQWFTLSFPFFYVKYPMDKRLFYRNLEEDRISTAPRVVVYDTATGKTYLRVPIPEAQPV